MERRTDDKVRRHLKRYELALRLMGHRARTCTIAAMTNLSRHQLATLRKRWRVSQDTRRRGPAPQSFAVFFHSSRARSEGASLAVLCRRYNAIPIAGSGLTKESLSLELGERLCVAFEVYQACFPASRLEFEQSLLLAVGLARADVLALENCANCGGAILVDRLSTPRNFCVHC